jgi:hypothetical protein
MQKRPKVEPREPGERGVTADFNTDGRLAKCYAPSANTRNVFT